MDPESPENGLECSMPISDKRARHKLVERNRRDKTRRFVQQLQSLLPNIKEHSQNPNTNDILEKTLEYLQCAQNKRLSGTDLQVDCRDDKRGEDNIDLGLVNSKLLASARFTVDDLSCRRYMLSFDNAPFGIVIARTDGLIIKANDFFQTLLHLPPGPLVGQTMFSLTSAKDLPITMKVRRSSPSLPLALFDHSRLAHCWSAPW